MDKITKTLRYTSLFNIYGNQLSSSQQEMINDYFFLDLSISEISQNRGISRSAVEDALNKGINKLEELENDLKMLEKSQNILQKLDILKEKSLNLDEVKEIEDIEKELDYGI